MCKLYVKCVWASLFNTCLYVYFYWLSVFGDGDCRSLVAKPSTHPVDQDQWQQYDEHEESDVSWIGSVVVGDRLDVGRHEDDIHATGTQLIDQQKCVDDMAIGKEDTYFTEKDEDEFIQNETVTSLFLLKYCL